MATTFDDGDNRKPGKNKPQPEQEAKPATKAKLIPIRRVVQLMLEDIEIYGDDILTEADVKNYDWPKKYIGQTYTTAMLDCTAVMLRAALNYHCPNSRVGA